jgi:hypothetical protein
VEVTKKQFKEEENLQKDRREREREERGRERREEEKEEETVTGRESYREVLQMPFCLCQMYLPVPVRDE